MMIKLNMLDACMKNRVGSNISSDEIVTINKDRPHKGHAKILKKIANPDGLSKSICNEVIFGFDA